MNNVLRKVLGDDYGGPSISVNTDTGEFYIYSWGDAPVSMTRHFKGANMQELSANVAAWLHKHRRRKTLPALPIIEG